MDSFRFETEKETLEEEDEDFFRVEFKTPFEAGTLYELHLPREYVLEKPHEETEETVRVSSENLDKIIRKRLWETSLDLGGFGERLTKSTFSDLYGFKDVREMYPTGKRDRGPDVMMRNSKEHYHIIEVKTVVAEPHSSSTLRRALEELSTYERNFSLKNLGVTIEKELVLVDLRERGREISKRKIDYVTQQGISVQIIKPKRR